jgi:3-isopropylmalate dehydrogenase
VRPERLEGVDILVVRELTGGIYFGRKERTADSATDVCTYTREEIERVLRMAGALARQRRRKVASIDKANVLDTSRLWRGLATEIFRNEFPDVALEHVLVDAAAMHLLSRPRDFDVLVTENMFGDILTDEASMLTGSLGMLPSAALGQGHRGLYEPIHGSAPDIAGQDRANPCGTILSAAMLLRHSLGLAAEAARIEAAVFTAIEAGHRTADIVLPGQAPCGTAALGAAIRTALAA